MGRQAMTFPEFCRFLAEGGYHVVWCGLGDDNHGEYTKALLVDLVCHWRLPDGKAKFVSVGFQTKEEFHHLLDQLRRSVEGLRWEVGKTVTRVEGLESSLPW